MNFDQIAPQLKTGDIILFHGTTSVSAIIDALFHSPFSHVAMVVREGGRPGNDNLYIWQSFEPQHGVVYEPLEPFLESYVKTEAGATFTVRQLSMTPDAQAVAKLSAFIAQVKGRPFPKLLPWIADYLLGTAGIATNETTFYCSELVAQSFMDMALLPPKPLATTYVPRSFSAANAGLPLPQGVSFGPEIPVTLDSGGAPVFAAKFTSQGRPAVDPVPPSAYPAFTPNPRHAPVMPDAWRATVLLHPFAPPPADAPHPKSPYFQMGLAAIDYVKDLFFSVRVGGCEETWWYMVTPEGTTLSLDEGKTWAAADIGWSLPNDWYGAQAPNVRSPGTSHLNWMMPQPRDWWVVPVPLPGDGPPAATWMWFDSASGAPVRMMFGNGPPSPQIGDPTQLAFFQMFSLIHFASFEALDPSHPKPAVWEAPSIAGLSVGNPKGYKPFVWPGNMAATTFSTPVNGLFNPLPSRTLYVWKKDRVYRTYSDRAQSTLMHYTYNQVPPPGQKQTTLVESLLTGVAPFGPPPDPQAGTGFLFTRYADGTEGCVTGGDFDFGQEPPDWLSVKGGQGTCEATIVDNPALGPNQTVTIWSVLFPPADKYPQGTYLWTWYSPLSADGTTSRPVLFMQSQSELNSGTSLALDDYYWFDTPFTPIDPANFEIPQVCLLSNAPAPPPPA